MTLLTRIAHDEAARAAANRRDSRDALMIVVPLVVLAVVAGAWSVAQAAMEMMK